MGKIRTKLDKSGEMVAYSDLAVRNNAAVVEYCRTSMAALSGSTAGLLGLTGFFGFGFYMFAVIGLWVLLLIKAGQQWKKYFINRKSLLTNGFFGGLFVKKLSGWIAVIGRSIKLRTFHFLKASSVMTDEKSVTYVLFWTFIYGMVHVY